ncbi:MAG: hypothetical protein WDL87_09020 [Candidatus Omnitrophota bacterium]|jgi:hypothetical protein
MKIFIAILVSIIGFLTWQFVHTNRGETLSFPDDSGYVWKFKKGKEMTLSGRILPYPPGIIGGSSVIKGSLQFCTEDAYRIFKEEYVKNKKSCQPFWKKYAKNFLLLTHSAAATRTMADLKPGKKVEMKFDYLRFIGTYSLAGKKMQNSWGWGGVHFLYVTEISVRAAG